MAIAARRLVFVTLAQFVLFAQFNSSIKRSCLILFTPVLKFVGLKSYNGLLEGLVLVWEPVKVAPDRYSLLVLLRSVRIRSSIEINGLSGGAILLISIASDSRCLAKATTLLNPS